MTRALSSGVGALAALALVGAAYLVAATVPGNDTLEAPFAEHGGIGDRLQGRSLDATLHGASLADEVRSPEWRGTTTGVWLVAELDLAAVSERTGLEADLLVDGVRYGASNRTGIEALTDQVHDAMLWKRGVVLVEFPPEVLDDADARSAVLRLSPGLDSRLDSVLEFSIDLSGLDHEAVVEFDDAREVAP